MDRHVAQISRDLCLDEFMDRGRGSVLPRYLIMSPCQGISTSADDIGEFRNVSAFGAGLRDEAADDIQDAPDAMIEFCDQQVLVFLRVCPFLSEASVIRRTTSINDMRMVPATRRSPSAA